MSVASRRAEVGRLQKSSAELQRKLAEEAKREAAKAKSYTDVLKSISRSTSQSTLRSKQQQLVRLNDDRARIEAKKGDLAKKLADTEIKLGKAKDALASEEEKERKRMVGEERKREREQLAHQRELTRAAQARAVVERRRTEFESPLRQIDAFVCHASEDKKDFVQPLVEGLKSAGYQIWYDDQTLRVGDGLRRSIDRGLLSCRYGIVVLSPSFFSKHWSNYELDGLLNRESSGHRVILPIWHRVTRDEVEKYSPSLADKIALNSSATSLPEIIAQLGAVLDRKHEGGS